MVNSNRVISTVGKSAYQVKQNESDIRREIMLYGPVEASIFIYDDFVDYKSGVYKYLTGRLITIQSVRIIGWGIENDIPYWLCANSWNEAWGLNGFFKILRGSNECEVETFVNAGRVDMK
ncbi:Cathepsin B-like cysteine proteinase [Schistosoma japonicum]|uniref:Cathepsin B-like cysteine proteinase n=1 Tax=Schistosoma japonicum TaxID=6182 RepID=A0A4Z2DAC1_SCHJA|nr:Cathepsin B-like cysteine proteinase [Schistosoma japonicum]